MPSQTVPPEDSKKCGKGYIYTLDKNYKKRFSGAPKDASVWIDNFRGSDTDDGCGIAFGRDIHISDPSNYKDGVAQLNHKEKILISVTDNNGSSVNNL